EAALATSTLTTQNVLKQCNVTALCTTDSPLSDLRYHQLIAESDFDVEVLPTFRADDLFAFGSPTAFRNMIDKLSTITALHIASINEFLNAISKRIEAFHDSGCRLSDLGLTQVNFVPCSHKAAQQLFE
ncbi:glucuronate isomerase, partial [Vibrio sp. F13]